MAKLQESCCDVIGLTETGALDGLRQAAASGLKLKIARYAAAASLLLGIGLIILIVVAIMI